MKDNILPFNKAIQSLQRAATNKFDRFPLHLGVINKDGEVIESDQAGFAFLRPGSKTFRIRLWALPQVQYFVSPDANNLTEYSVLSLEEYQANSGEIKTNWNKIGTGKLVGSFIRLWMPVFNLELFLCLYPSVNSASEVDVA